jgi:deazaflavin-dependent oxidoreductase (nitroreductase family)
VVRSALSDQFAPPATSDNDQRHDSAGSRCCAFIHLLNPAMMHLAGRKHWYAGVIRHTGRRCGKCYATPVIADRVADGFVVPLPYGTGVDWLRNVLAAGEATVTVGGRTYDVIDPEIINAH